MATLSDMSYVSGVLVATPLANVPALIGIRNKSSGVKRSIGLSNCGPQHPIDMRFTFDPVKKSIIDAATLKLVCGVVQVPRCEQLETYPVSWPERSTNEVGLPSAYP